jgi:NDP-sugar pyrophosphorylase family protein
MIMRAVVLAGGEGARLKPYTYVLPKPLMPVGEYPVMEIIVRQLAYYGYKHITITVGYHAEIIQSFFGNGEKWNIKIDYSLEDKPLSTMGPLKLIKDLPDNFLVMNGDVLTDLNYNDLYAYHMSNRNIFTISAYQRVLKSEYGVLEINTENQLIGFQEKPVVTYDVSMGIYVVNNKILEYIPEGKIFGFDHLMRDLIKLHIPVSVKKYNGYWLDIGRPEDYTQAVEEFAALKEKFLK